MLFVVGQPDGRMEAMAHLAKDLVFSITESVANAHRVVATRSVAFYVFLAYDLDRLGFRC